MLYCEQCGFAISHAQLREFVVLLSSSAGGPTRVGRQWVSRFLSRHPEVKTKIGKKLEVLRTENITSERLTTWFDTLAGHIKRLEITPPNLYNMDETGIALGVCTNTRVIGKSSTNTTIIKRPENCEWISIIETISAAGKKLRPVVIFKAKNSIQSSWFRPGEVPDWLYTNSENGWTSNNIRLAWLNEVFDPETRNGHNRLLLVDGHGSHLSVPFMTAAWQKNIWIYYLSPHTSHVLQPLDLSVFKFVKNAYRDRITDLASIEDSAPIKKIRFIQYYQHAREIGLSSSHIISSWLASGIVPWNPRKVITSQPSKPTRLFSESS